MEQKFDANKFFNLCKRDFKSFVSMIVGLKNEPFHNEIDDAISNPLNKQMVVSISRGHGKSTHLSVAYPLWEMSRNHNVRILLISATGAVSKSFMTEVIGHIERNPKYTEYALKVDPLGKGVIPRMKNYAKQRENWAGDSILIDREEVNMKDPTINAVGLFG